MIIILNGPPGSGKDTLAEFFKQDGYEHYSFKEPMFRIAQAVLGSHTYFTKFLPDYESRLTKESPQEYLGNLSPRDFMIHISEKWCKPLFGGAFFGEHALASIGKTHSEGIVVSDGGFPSELVPLLKAGQAILVCRLHRKGHTFQGDSRRYLYPGDFEHMPINQRPLFLDVEVVEGLPSHAAYYIRSKINA